MDFNEAFQIVISKWPSHIDISDTTLHDSGGATIPELIKAHDQIEDECMELGDEVVAMDWSLFQYFHSIAKQLYISGNNHLRTSVIDLDKLEHLYNENISE